MELKAKIQERYRQLLQDRMDVFRDMIVDLAIDAQNDAKSSAGDKHETALSMMQLEQEKLNAKLAEIMAQKDVIERIDINTKHHKVALGSLVNANNMRLFVSAALPKITIEDQTIIAVSPQSPLGTKLMGKEIGFEFEIGTTSYCIKSID